MLIGLMVMILFFMLSYYISWCVPVGVLKKQNKTHPDMKNKGKILCHEAPLYIAHYCWVFMAVC